MPDIATMVNAGIASREAKAIAHQPLTVWSATITLESGDTPTGISQNFVYSEDGDILTWMGELTLTIGANLSYSIGISAPRALTGASSGGGTRITDGKGVCWYRDGDIFRVRMADNSGFEAATQYRVDLGGVAR